MAPSPLGPLMNSRSASLGAPTTSQNSYPPQNFPALLIPLPVTGNE